jgi:hypothetical protein
LEKIMHKSLLTYFVLVATSIVSGAAIAGSCLPIDYQELKELPREVLLAELCSAKKNSEFNKIHGDSLSLSAKMNRNLGDAREASSENKKAIEAYEVRTVCEKQIERIQRQLVQVGEKEASIEILCPAKAK